MIYSNISSFFWHYRRRLRFQEKLVSSKKSSWPFSSVSFTCSSVLHYFLYGFVLFLYYYAVTTKWIKVRLVILQMLLCIFCLHICGVFFSFIYHLLIIFYCYRSNSLDNSFLFLAITTVTFGIRVSRYDMIP